MSGAGEMATSALPTNYSAMKVAIAECDKVDECKEWADKAAALAAYHRMSRDKENAARCERIRARAVDRAGEFQGKKQTGFRVSSSEEKTGSYAAGKAAGMTEKQIDEAIAVNKVPRDQFERQVESDNPPTVSELARQGRKPSTAHLKGRDPADYAAATPLLGLLRGFRRDAEKIDTDKALRGVDDAEMGKLRADAQWTTDWLLTLIERLDKC